MLNAHASYVERQYRVRASGKKVTTTEFNTDGDDMKTVEKITDSTRVMSRQMKEEKKIERAATHQRQASSSRQASHQANKQATQQQREDYVHVQVFKYLTKMP